MEANDLNAEKETKHNRSSMIGVFGLDMIDGYSRAFREEPAKYGPRHPLARVCVLRSSPSLSELFFFFFFLFLDELFVFFGSGPFLVLLVVFFFLLSFSRLLDHDIAFNCYCFERAHHGTHFGNARLGQPANSPRYRKKGP
ncbi:hypothetical protein J3F83DRAFT_752342 [Trichoderma novae-zelandiae]